MKTTAYTFDQLSKTQLYDLLQLRSEVFVVEQDCVYQDLDGKDSKALHILGYVDDVLVAYTRAFAPGDYFDTAAIGRVVVAKDYRAKDFGKKIMEASINAVEAAWGTSSIKLSAQTYLKRFYNDLGFEAMGDEYLEDGIPHILMKKA